MHLDMEDQSLTAKEGRSLAKFLVTRATKPEAAKNAREGSGLTFQEVATLVGVDKATIMRWEKTDTFPMAKAAGKWADLMLRMIEAQTKIKGEDNEQVNQ